MSLKEQVLDALLDGEPISGEALADRLGVTRSAVWKAVGQLREEGYQVQAATNRGYRITDCGRLSAQAIAHYGAAGTAIELHDCIGSTNDRAKELAAGGARDLCVIADRQDGGKGRMGRSFFSPPGCGLYGSLILHPTMRAQECAALITTYAAVAVAECVEELTGGKAGIKWVNDVWMNGRKICGILTEASVDFESGGFAYAVVGIGINVRKAKFPPEVAAVATDLETETGVQVDRNRLAARLLRKFAGMEQELQSREYLNRYRQRCIVLGKDLHITRGGEAFDAKALEINDQGELIVQTGDGTLRTLNSGEVSTKFAE